MSDEYEIDYDGVCPKCGHSPTHYRECREFGCEEGWVDESEDDYMLPGTEMVKCDECKGSGTEEWCPSCGANLSGLIQSDLED